MLPVALAETSYTAFVRPIVLLPESVLSEEADAGTSFVVTRCLSETRYVICISPF